MKFKKAWPEENGYYWYVDTSYAVPKLGFVLQDSLIDDNVVYKQDEKYTNTFIRFGDRIKDPSVTEMEIED